LINRVSPRYFETIGTRVLRGRTFDAHDTPGSRPVIVVTDDFVQRFLPGREPIGQSITIDSEGRDAPLEIVGVVERAKYDEPREPVRPMIFLPLLQMKAGESPVSSDYRSNFIEAIEVRSVGDPAEIAGAVRRAVTEIAPDLPVLRVETLSARILRTMSQDSAVAMLASTFGLLVLALTTIGLYGLMAYLVQRRTGEIGVRMALGADRARVTWMVLGDALRQAAIGTLVGIPAAFAATRMLGSQLYDVSPTDPRSAAAAAIVLVACLTAAGYLPARRAARIDPIRALRTE
jgi:predicted permease